MLEDGVFTVRPLLEVGISTQSLGAEGYTDGLLVTVTPETPGMLTGSATPIEIGVWTGYEIEEEDIETPEGPTAGWSTLTETPG